MFNNDESYLNQGCRSCLLNTANTKSLYDQYSTDMCVADVFVFVTSLEFSGDSDGLPTHICTDCYRELTQSYKFVTKCQKSHKQLENHINSRTTTQFVHVDIKLEIDDDQTAPNPLKTELDVIKHELDTDNKHELNDYINYRNEIDPNRDANLKTKHTTPKRNQNDTKTPVANVCEQCNIEFTTYDLLLAHYRLINHDKMAANCRYCSKRHDTNDLHDHIQAAHSNSLTNQLNTDDATTIDTCSVCGLNFDHKGNLKRHMATHSGEKPHHCDICAKSFHRKESLTYHMLSHTGKQPYLFPVTDEFINKARVTHKVIHIKRTQYSCAICDKTFNHKGKVRRHMLTHTGQKPYSCDVCDKSFNQKENLSRHVLTHSGHKPHACTVCDRSFTHKENLTYHMVTHTEQKPYACPQCDKAFIQKTKLNRHLLTHSKQRPYSCEVCEKSFIKIGNLNRHLVTHANQTPSL